MGLTVSKTANRAREALDAITSPRRSSKLHKDVVGTCEELLEVRKPQRTLLEAHAAVANDSIIDGGTPRRPQAQGADASEIDDTSHTPTSISAMTPTRRPLPEEKAPSPKRRKITHSNAISCHGQKERNRHLTEPRSATLCSTPSNGGYGTAVWAGATQGRLMTVLHNAPAEMEKVLRINLEPLPKPKSWLSRMDLHEACRALKSKLDTEKGAKRQSGRRLKSEPFKLSNSQIMLLAHRYKAARCDGRAVDYPSIAGSTHFPTFEGHAQVLQDTEPFIIRLLESALREKRASYAGIHRGTNDTWENDKVQLHHQQQLAACQAQIEELKRRLESEVSLSNDLVIKLVQTYAEKRWKSSSRQFERKANRLM